MGGREGGVGRQQMRVLKGGGLGCTEGSFEGKGEGWEAGRDGWKAGWVKRWGGEAGRQIWEARKGGWKARRLGED